MNNRPDKSNVKQPSCDDDQCHFCGDDNTAVVIRGNHAAGCNYCSNEIAMCQFCYSVMVDKADKLMGRK